ncbi:Rhamnogalacturonan endolyase YesW [bacterium HR17]|uniref:Rhamnogalacturonan endolyase YesW n=1 Tax=Candidatus Fervidibacter japonicus TaxID=2035412 RepID=A0A2H5XF44_9BACT|nr:Rhamnogalacturonan endolyase YesW [bacterium HR17]
MTTPKSFFYQTALALAGATTLLATALQKAESGHALTTTPPAQPLRQMERLGRGIVAVRIGDDRAFVAWRLLATDPEGIAFNLYRRVGHRAPVRVNTTPITQSTCFVDNGVDFRHPVAYFVRPVVNGKEVAASASFHLPANVPVRPYITVPMRQVPGDTAWVYAPNDASVGDLDGDGEYELVVKREWDAYDPAQNGICRGTTKLEAYKLDGTFLWRIDLGPNIRSGAHYTPFLVYDFDGDGKAEVVARTAELTVDGTGNVIGDVDGDGRTNYVNPQTGRILEGPEFLSVFDGRTGREIARTRYIPRGKVSEWGDNYGNRCDRFLMAIAYLDGVHPSIVMCRGYYAKTVLEAWDFHDGKLVHRWTFDTTANGGRFRTYEGQGNHNLFVGDVDGDGKDEIIYGACAVDDNGSGLYSTGWGHGDAMHLSDIDPDRAGLEVFQCHERPHPYGVTLRDAATGKLLWGFPAPRDVGRALAADIDPRFRGYECWAAGGGLWGKVWNCKGERIADAQLPVNMAVWWDDDLLRELLDDTVIAKWDWQAGKLVRLFDARKWGCVSNNGTKANPCLVADILGDWREEVLWRTADNRALRLFVSTVPTPYRLYTLMHDPVYRLSVAHQNVGYNMPTQTGFYLGDGMTHLPKPRILCR